MRITERVEFLAMSEPNLSDESISAVFSMLHLDTEDKRASHSFQSFGGNVQEEPSITVFSRTIPEGTHT